MEIEKNKIEIKIRKYLFFDSDLRKQKIPNDRKNRAIFDSKTILDVIMCHGDETNSIDEIKDSNLLLVSSYIIKPKIMTVRSPSVIEGSLATVLLLLKKLNKGESKYAYPGVLYVP